MHYKMTQNHETEIAVMKSEYNLTKEGHDALTMVEAWCDERGE
jgi:hypothetical protein